MTAAEDIKVEENKFTAADFLKSGSERFDLALVIGGNSLKRIIEEPVVNRPGLALTGFYEHFAAARVQMLGNAEMAYLNSRSQAVRSECFRKMIEHDAWLFVFTSGHKPSPEDVAIAKEAGAVIMTTSLETRMFARNATFIFEQLGAPRTSIYGTMVEVCGLGVLFEGAPGMGKSETALGLIKRGCALVADDFTNVRKDVANNLLFGSASAATAGYMEIRGIGILHVPSVFGVSSVRGEKSLQLVITFRPLDEIKGEIDRIGQTRRTRNILGVEVPNIIIPVSEGRDLVNLVETAAQQQKLMAAGSNPVVELSNRLHKRAMNQELNCKEERNG